MAQAALAGCLVGSYAVSAATRRWWSTRAMRATRRLLATPVQASMASAVKSQILRTDVKAAYARGLRQAIPCRECGYTAVEVNASDTRNKADNSAAKGIGGKLSNALAELCTNTSLSGASKGKKAGPRLCACVCVCVCGERHEWGCAERREGHQQQAVQLAC